MTTAEEIPAYTPRGGATVLPAASITKCSAVSPAQMPRKYPMSWSPGIPIVEPEYRACTLVRPGPSYLSLTIRIGALMAAVETLTTTVSTKGQVILPKTIRQRRHWEPGTRLVVEDTPDGVLLKAAPVLAPTRPEDVAGMLAYRGPPKTLEEMDAAITAEVTRRRARGRY